MISRVSNFSRGPWKLSYFRKYPYDAQENKKFNEDKTGNRILSLLRGGKVNTLTVSIHRPPTTDLPLSAHSELLKVSDNNENETKYYLYQIKNHFIN